MVSDDFEFGRFLVYATRKDRIKDIGFSANLRQNYLYETECRTLATCILKGLNVDAVISEK